MLDELKEEVLKGRAERPLLQAPPEWRVVLPETEAGRPSPTKPTAYHKSMGGYVFCRRAERQGPQMRRLQKKLPQFYNHCRRYASLWRRRGLRGHDTIQHLQARGFKDIKVLGQDLAGAYRQIPVRPGEDP